ncbi:unnamed protein product [Phaeothamnion confervicola]
MRCLNHALASTLKRKGPLLRGWRIFTAQTPAAKEFDEHFAAVYGERWPSLRASLLQPKTHAVLLNCFEDAIWTRKWLAEHVPSAVPACGALPVECLKAAEPGAAFPPPPIGPRGLLSYYLMDLASIFAAALLAPRPGDVVADICAAPGGKSIVLAQSLLLPWHYGEDSSGNHCGSDKAAATMSFLMANDSSATRYRRLRAVTKAYLPAVAAAHLQLTCVNAVRWHLRRAAPRHPAGCDFAGYDRVLVDVPCSAERHLLLRGAAASTLVMPGGETSDGGGPVAAVSAAAAAVAPATELAAWTPRRSRRLTTLQRGLLSAALLSARPGGLVLYATCSISPAENDGVVAEVVRRGKAGAEAVVGPEQWPAWAAEVLAAHFPGADRTPAGGVDILPDRCDGWGPLYVALLRRRDDSGAI